MQPLLLLKQTLEDPGDPGAIKLDGANAKFTEPRQLLRKLKGRECAATFAVGIEVAGEDYLEMKYRASEKQEGLVVASMGLDRQSLFEPDMSHHDVLAQIPERNREELVRLLKEPFYKGRSLEVIREKCFLNIAMIRRETSDRVALVRSYFSIYNFGPLVEILRGVIHLPGYRGDPRRSYPVSTSSGAFPGTFEEHSAALIYKWIAENDVEAIARLKSYLNTLELTWTVHASKRNATEIQVEVGRLRKAVRGGARDRVNIADVGFGVSQAMPVLVALIAARPGQLVYIEQPEIHLHPKAQVALAGVFAEAVTRGVQVVVETHSDLLLLGIQTAVARGDLGLSDVILHWFSNEGGESMVESRRIDKDGSYGDWPVDFTDVTLRAEAEYIEIASRQLVSSKRSGVRVKAGQNGKDGRH